MAGIGHIVTVSCSKSLFRLNSLKLRWGCVRCLSVMTTNARYPSYTSGLSPYKPVIYHNIYQSRCFSQKKGFFSEMINNIRTEIDKNKEMKDNLKKFREEADKLEQSEALKKAREKYESIESETSKGTDILKKGFSGFGDKLKEAIEEVEKTELGKRSKDIAEGLGKTAQRTADTLKESGEHIGKSAVFKSVSEGMSAVKKEIDETTLSRGRPYKAPKKLQRRSDDRKKDGDDKQVEANPDATGIMLHKDSQWYQSWQNFKDNNQFVTKMFDMKMKYDESDNLFVRATRTFTDKIGDVFGSVFSKTEMSEVLTEIVKMDPNFDTEQFLRDCQNELIPNILEAMVRGDLEILQDWCYEAAFNTIAHPIRQAQAAGYKLDSKILDINRVDLAAGKMMEQGPVLVLVFSAQQIIAVRDARGKVVEGDMDKIMKVFHVWAFCRDQTVLDPKAAWRLIDISSSAGNEQWL